MKEIQNPKKPPQQTIPDADIISHKKQDLDQASLSLPGPNELLDQWLRFWKSRYNDVLPRPAWPRGRGTNGPGFGKGLDGLLPSIVDFSTTLEV